MSGVEFSRVADSWVRGLRFVNADNAVLVMEVGAGCAGCSALHACPCFVAYATQGALPDALQVPPRTSLPSLTRRLTRRRHRCRCCPQSERVTASDLSVEVSQPRLGPPEGPFKRRFDGHWGLRIGEPGPGLPRLLPPPPVLLWSRDWWIAGPLRRCRLLRRRPPTRDLKPMYPPANLSRTAASAESRDILLTGYTETSEPVHSFGADGRGMMSVFEDATLLGGTLEMHRGQATQNLFTNIDVVRG